MSREDPAFSFLYKIVMAFVMMLGLIYFIPVALGTFGLFQCTGCDSLTVIFALGFLPVAAVFIVIYFIWKQFASRN